MRPLRLWDPRCGGHDFCGAALLGDGLHEHLRGETLRTGNRRINSRGRESPYLLTGGYFLVAR
ncbi:hypothetical protein GCM10010400_13410 [Streptomyces aculeolatus]